MKLSNEELMKDFHKVMQDKYPDITLEQTKEICNGPWKFLKAEMESGNLNEVRMKYFGVFRVYPGRAKEMLFKLKDRFKYHKVAKDEYFRIKTMLEKFIERNEKEIK